MHYNSTMSTIRAATDKKNTYLDLNLRNELHKLASDTEVISFRYIGWLSAWRLNDTDQHFVVHVAREVPPFSFSFPIKITRGTIVCRPEAPNSSIYSSAEASVHFLTNLLWPFMPLQWQCEEGRPFYRIWRLDRNIPQTLTQITPCIESLLDFLTTLWLRSTKILVVRQPKLSFGLTLHRCLSIFHGLLLTRCSMKHIRRISREYPWAFWEKWQNPRSKFKFHG